MKKNYLKNFLFVCCFLTFGFVSGQQTVSGTVSDETGPLPGANVIVKGTSNGTTTNFDGNYELNNVPSDGTLVFSYISYETKEIAVNGRSEINVNLVSSSEALTDLSLNSLNFDS